MNILEDILISIEVCEKRMSVCNEKNSPASEHSVRKNNWSSVHSAFSRHSANGEKTEE